MQNSDSRYFVILFAEINASGALLFINWQVLLKSIEPEMFRSYYA
jgi:hypothetical protein